jgi:hypothetical protein
MAEFEIVHRQVGAIILMNNHVVGIEVTPNYQYWSDVWQPMVREAYGSLALQYSKLYGDNPAPPLNRVFMRDTIGSIKNIGQELDRVKRAEERKVLDIIRKFLDEPFQIEHKQKEAGLDVETIRNTQFKGQIVRDDEKIVYASLVTTGKWIKNKGWYEAEDFKI